ncbi:MAG: metallophosphoesterase family protein [Acidilobaceae archaeon]
MEEMPTFSQLKKALEELRDLLRKEENGEVPGFVDGFKRKGGVVELTLPKDMKIAVIGDIHGDYETFSKILEELENSEVVKRGVLITLGDYIDRGPPEGQILLLYKLSELKKEMKTRFIMLRGNHEPPSWPVPEPHDYPWALKELYGYERGEELYSLSREVFNVMPHAVVLKEVALLVHGGPPTQVESSDVFSYLAYNRDVEVLKEILWNDPSDAIEQRVQSPRGVGYLWGSSITEKVLSLLGVKFIVRGHEPAYYGFKTNHEDKVFTLFSRLGSPYYNERAAFLTCSVDEFEKDPKKCVVYVTSSGLFHCYENKEGKKKKKEGKKRKKT